VPWVVDTCILIDVAEDDPQFGKRSARLLDRRRSTGLLVAPVSYVELAPLFNGVIEAQNEFFESVGVHCTHSWTWPDTVAAHGAWHHYIHRRHRNRIRKRPIDNILIVDFHML